MNGRLVDYFSSVGLDPGSTPALATPLEAGSRAVVDVTLVNHSKREAAPDGYELVRTSIGGRDAALNGGALFGDRCYLALRRGPPRSALADLDVLFADKEQPKPQHEILVATASGKMADLHGSAKLKTALTMRRRGVIQSVAELYECAPRARHRTLRCHF